jgi:hypothetical protein
MSGHDFQSLSVEKGRDYYGLYYIEGAPFRISFWTHGTDISEAEGKRRLAFANALVAAWNNREMIGSLRAALAARDARLANIAALARKHQAVCGADGNWAAVEGFATIGKDNT